MPAFNIAQNQQLAQPVSSFFQGKAMAIAEKNQARKMEIEEERLAMEERRLGQADRGLDLEEGRLAASVLEVRQTAQDKLVEASRKETIEGVTNAEFRHGQSMLLEPHLVNPSKKTTQEYMIFCKKHWPSYLGPLGGSKQWILTATAF